jgi:hypothetical protein
MSGASVLPAASLRTKRREHVIYLAYHSIFKYQATPSLQHRPELVLGAETGARALSLSNSLSHEHSGGCGQKAVAASDAQSPRPMRSRRARC